MKTTRLSPTRAWVRAASPHSYLQPAYDDKLPYLSPLPSRPLPPPFSGLGDDYNEKHGNKWTLDDLRLYLEATRGTETAQRLFDEVDAVVVRSLKACQV